MVFVGEFLPGFGGRQPDSLVIVNCERFHSGNLPHCRTIFKGISGWVKRTFWRGFFRGVRRTDAPDPALPSSKKGGLHGRRPWKLSGYFRRLEVLQAPQRLST